jgi:hypothetical protein
MGLLVWLGCSGFGTLMTPLGHFQVEAAWFVRAPTPLGEWTVAAVSNAPVPCTSLASVEDADLMGAALCGEGAVHIATQFWRPWDTVRAGTYDPDEVLDVGTTPEDPAARVWRGDAYGVEEAEWPELYDGVRIPDVTQSLNAPSPTGEAHIIDSATADLLEADFRINEDWSGHFIATHCGEWDTVDLFTLVQPGVTCP